MTDVVEIRTRQDSHARARLSTVNGGLEGSRLIAPPGHLLVAGGCRVPGCRRTGRAGDGLCGRHGNLWQLEGKPQYVQLRSHSVVWWHVCGMGEAGVGSAVVGSGVGGGADAGVPRIWSTR